MIEQFDAKFQQYKTINIKLWLLLYKKNVGENAYKYMLVKRKL